MRIAIFTDLFLELPGGVPSSITAQVAELTRLGHKVEIFCPGWRIPKNLRDLPIRLAPTCRFFHPMGCPMAHNWHRVAKFVRADFAKHGQPDIIHVQSELATGLAGMRVAREFGIPLVITMHGREDVAMTNNFPVPNLIARGANLWHRAIIPHRKKIARDDYLAQTAAAARMWEMMVNHANFADTVITPSHQFADKLRHYGVDRPIAVVSNGISDEKLAQLPPAKQRVWRTGEPLKIVWTSRMSREKRPLELIYALTKVDFSYSLDFYGDGNLENAARELVKKLRLGDKIRVHGRVSQDEILAALANAHLSSVLSYGFDTQSIALLESLATGLPTLIVDPDLRETLPRGGYILTSQPDIAAIARALDNLAKNSQKIAQMSRVLLAHRDDALQSRQIKALLKVYEKLARRA